MASCERAFTKKPLLHLEINKTHKNCMHVFESVNRQL